LPLLKFQPSYSFVEKRYLTGGITPMLVGMVTVEHSAAEDRVQNIGDSF